RFSGFYEPAAELQVPRKRSGVPQHLRRLHASPHTSRSWYLSHLIADREWTLLAVSVRKPRGDPVSLRHPPQRGCSRARRRATSLSRSCGCPLYPNTGADHTCPRADLTPPSAAIPGKVTTPPCTHSRPDPRHDSMSDRCHPGNELWSRG